jgi:hypothetical protein
LDSHKHNNIITQNDRTENTRDVSALIEAQGGMDSAAVCVEAPLFFFCALKYLQEMPISYKRYFKMKLILLILGIAVVALNLFLWYSKKQAGKTNADESSSHKDRAGVSAARPIEFSKSPEIEPLKQSAAAELGISIEQLDCLSVEEIEKIAAEKGLINPDG